MGRGRPLHPDRLTPAEWRVVNAVRHGVSNIDGDLDPGRKDQRFTSTFERTAAQLVRIDLVSDTQTGIMIYDSLGNMAAQAMPNRVRRKYAAAEPTTEEAKDAITGYLAYFGTYMIDEQARTVTHHRKGNINPRLVLTPAGSTNKIVWERAR